MAEVTLRKWEASDKESLMTLCNAIDRRYLSDRLPSPYRMTDAEAWLKMVEDAEGREGVYRAIVTDNRIVGSISVERKADVFRVDGEIGYMLLTDYWSRGITTLAVGLIVDTAFSLLGLRRISGLVYKENAASAKVLMRNDFVLEGTLRQAAIKNDCIHDLLLYALVR